MRSEAKHVGHAEEKKRSQKEKTGYSALWEVEAKQRAILANLCEFQSEQETQRKRVSTWEVQSEELERYIVRVWESQ